MSFVATFLPELQPFFRTLDDPFAIAPPHGRTFRRTKRQDSQVESYSGASRSLISELGFGGLRSPIVQVTEEGDEYVVNAEVPGVRKEELDVSVGDGGRSLRIQGGRSSPAPTPAEGVASQVEAASSSAVSTQGSDSATGTATSRRFLHSFAGYIGVTLTLDCLQITSRPAYRPQPLNPTHRAQSRRRKHNRNRGAYRHSSSLERSAFLS